jgi:hypothetical protein
MVGLDAAQRPPGRAGAAGPVRWRRDVGRPRRAGATVVRELAAELGLAEPTLPWHTIRTPIADLAGALGTTAGAAGKVARDITLLAQDEVAEVREGKPGGSSAMAHKRNRSPPSAPWPGRPRLPAWCPLCSPPWCRSTSGRPAPGTPSGAAARAAGLDRVGRVVAARVPYPAGGRPLRRPAQSGPVPRGVRRPRRRPARRRPWWTGRWPPASQGGRGRDSRRASLHSGRSGGRSGPHPRALPGSTGAMWDPQVPALAATFRVVRYDHRGHGGSPVPPGPYSLDDLGGDVLALMDRSGWSGPTSRPVAGRHGLHVGRRERAGAGRPDGAAVHLAKLGPPEVWATRAETVRTEGLEPSSTRCSAGGSRPSAPPAGPTSWRPAGHVPGHAARGVRRLLRRHRADGPRTRPRPDHRAHAGDRRASPTSRPRPRTRSASPAASSARGWRWSPGWLTWPT